MNIFSENFFGSNKKESAAEKELREKVFDPTILTSYEEVEQCLDNMTTGPYGLGAPKGFDAINEKGKMIFEFWNKEYIDALGNYLSRRVEDLGGTEEHPVRILEVGAGNGALTHFLQEKLDADMPGKTVMIACDSEISNDWVEENKIDSVFPVQKIDHQGAIATHKPNIIIFSWMPYKYDCTDDFRAAESVEEYILIGETDYGCCGDEWKTWGIAPSEEDREAGKDYRTPLYEQDGFERAGTDGGNVSKFQASRLRFINLFGGETSETVSFKRKK